MGKLVEETGNRYGSLVVLEYAGGGKNIGATWLCVCDCGRTRVVKGGFLRNGNTSHCGKDFHRKKRKDIINETGNRYGHLVVVGFSKEKTESAVGVWWNCKCDCGGEKIVNGSVLRRGRVTSCGCKFANKRPYGEAAFNSVYKRMKKGAESRGYKWLLSKDIVKKITSEKCFYCGEKPSQIGGSRNSNGNYIYNGIDRIINSVGYRMNNVVACCRQCNFSKGKLSKEEFLDWVQRVYEKAR